MKISVENLYVDIGAERVNEFIIRKLNPLLVVDFRLISAFLHA